MNIIIDEQQFNILRDRIIFSGQVGSPLYGFENEKSDKDVMHLYLMSPKELSFLLGNTFYQLQYRQSDPKSDHLLVSLQGFFRNILNGGSTIPFELMHTKNFQNTFKINVKDFYNYNILKAYLGLVKRDLERIYKLSSLYDKRKVLAHSYRGYVFAREIFEGRTLRLRIDEYDNSIKNNFSVIRDMKREWSLEDDEISSSIYAKTMELRDQCNTQVQDGILFRYMDPIKQRELDNYIYELSIEQNMDFTGDLDLQPIRDSLELAVK